MTANKLSMGSCAPCHDRALCHMRLQLRASVPKLPSRSCTGLLGAAYAAARVTLGQQACVRLWHENECAPGELCVCVCMCAQSITIWSQIIAADRELVTYFSNPDNAITMLVRE